MWRAAKIFFGTAAIMGGLFAALVMFSEPHGGAYVCHPLQPPQSEPCE